MDLFTPVVPTERQHRFYRLICSQACEGQRAVLDGWANGFEDRDGKFVKEFQTTFDPSFWELYLAAAFRALGAELDFSHARPDFLVTPARGSAFSAEATVARHASGYVPASETAHGPPPELEARLEHQSLRLSNAISSKLLKYRNAYGALPHVSGKPFVICVAPFEQRWGFSLADRAIRRVLFAADIPLFLRDQSGDRVIVGEAASLSVWKESGADVPFGLFRAPESAPEVSAVLFSATATFGKLTVLSPPPTTFVTAVRYNENATEPDVFVGPLEDYDESLLDGLHLFLNPHASIPLDARDFIDAGVAVHTISPSGDYLTTTPHGFLFARSIVRRVPDGSAGDPALHHVPKHDPTLKVPSTAPFPDEAPRLVGGNVGTTTDVHLAHFQGWTILLARDVVDNDWGCLFRPGIYRALAAFQAAGKKDDLTEIGGFHPSLDNALDVAQERIRASASASSPRAG